MKTLLLLLVISIGSNETSAKSIGQMLDDTINYLTSRMTNTKETKMLETKVERLEKMHSCTAPCKYHSKVCDCTAFEPKQDCLEFKKSGQTISGTYRLKKHGFYSSTAYCDQETMGGGWTVIQRRQDGSVSFNRNWNEYKVGFGQLSGEFWYGNENIHDLTRPSTASELLINMRMMNETRKKYAQYTDFSIDDEANQYAFKINNETHPYDNMFQFNNMSFSTYDKVNSQSRCGYSGWWHTENCMYGTNLNAVYRFTRNYDEIRWGYYWDPQPEFVEMKVRRTQ